MKSTGSREFWQSYHKLPFDIRQMARAAYRKFVANPAHPSLSLERLRSNPKLWSVRVTRDYRAVAIRLENDTWIWIWIGSHADFDRQFSV